MPSSAPTDGADKGTSKADQITGGDNSVGNDPYVGSFPNPTKEGGDAYCVTGGQGDKTGDGMGEKGSSYLE